MHALHAWCRAPDATGACPETVSLPGLGPASHVPLSQPASKQHRCQSEPPTWLGPTYRVLTFVTYVIPLTIIGLVASVLTIFVNAMIAFTIVTIVMCARMSARAIHPRVKPRSKQG
jgi:hypothetical protein